MTITDTNSLASHDSPNLHLLVTKVTSTIAENHLDFIKEEIVKSLHSRVGAILLVCDSRPKDEVSLIELVTNSLSGKFDSQGFEEWKRNALNYWDRWTDGADPSASYIKIFSDLENALLGISLIREVSPKLIARILAFPSQIATEVAYAYFNSKLPGGCMNLDVKHFLRTGAYRPPKVHMSTMDSDSNYLSDGNLDVIENDTLQLEIDQLLCDFERQLRDHFLSAGYDDTYIDHELLEQIQKNLGEKRVIIAQGNVGMDAQDNITLFGPAGADISAAILAAKLNAQGVDYWTHDFGLFSCQISGEEPPSGSHLLRRLTYDEAQEIAATHPSMLNPGAIKILSENSISINFKSMRLREQDLHSCTFIGSEVESSENDSRVKCVCMKSGVILMSIDSLNMWRQVGFLAAVSNTVKKHNLSVDCIATSEANITLTFDTHADMIELNRIQELENDLRTLNCNVRTHGPCTAISLIGKNIWAVFSKLGDSVQLFENENIHLISQASSDVNLTFIVNQDRAKEITIQLHKRLIGESSQTVEVSLESKDSKRHDLLEQYSHFWWWKNEEKRQKLLSLIDREDEALYVYDPEVLERNAEILNNFIHIGAVDRVYYAMKANSYDEILKIFYNKNLGFECVSVEEVQYVLSLFPDIDKNRILFTPNFCPKKDYEAGFNLGVIVTVDNSYPLLHWGEVFRGKDIWIRVDPGKGLGHHQKVNTGGAQSKFGIPMDELPVIAKLAEELQCRVVGLHTHKGSGILDKTESWFETASHLNNLIDIFPHVRFIDVGGGLGVPHKSTDTPLDMSALSSFLISFKNKNPNIQIVMEPGRFLVAVAGVLLARVTQTKQKGSFAYIGCETGMNSLMRPTLYGSYHEIVNLTRLHEPADFMIADICGPICESGDILGVKRPMPKTESGDVLLIAMGGAYGYTMSSHYNMRKPAKNILLQ